MNVVNVTKETFDEEVLKAEQPVLMDFNANWCGPCQMLGPILEDLAKEKSNIKFVSINIDENEDLATQYNVYSIPCLIMMENGNEKKRKVGFMAKEELESFIED